MARSTGRTGHRRPAAMAGDGGEGGSGGDPGDGGCSDGGGAPGAGGDTGAGGAPGARGSRPVHRHAQGRDRGRERECRGRCPGRGDRGRRAPRGRDGSRRGLRSRRSGGRRVPRECPSCGLRAGGGRGVRGGGCHRGAADRAAHGVAARHAQRRPRGAHCLRAQPGRRTDDEAAAADDRRDRGGGQPAGRVRAGGGRVRLRRLVEQHRRAGVPGDPQRGADRHHHRRLSQRHVGLLQRGQGEPVHRRAEPGRRRGVAGDGRHRLAVGRGPRRHVRLPDGRALGREGLHGVGHAGGVRGAAVRRAGRDRFALRGPHASLGRRGPPGGHRLGAGIRAQRA